VKCGVGTCNPQEQDNSSSHSMVWEQGLTCHMIKQLACLQQRKGKGFSINSVINLNSVGVPSASGDALKVTLRVMYEHADRDSLSRVNRSRID